jgi:ligand-binding SRPBCC domain-containing protein
MRHFRHAFKVEAGLEAVAQFHQDTRALKKLTPPPVFAQLHQVQPLAEGSLAEFTMWMGPFPVRWLARHENVDPQKGFTDVQERGPFKSWRHIHTFRSLDENRSEVQDEIFAEPGLGFYNGLVSRLMWLNLPILFAYRGWATRRNIPTQ